MTFQTRSQRDLTLALALVQPVAVLERQVREIYGGLCHQFPVMVRRVGLAQTLAFHESKAAGEAPRSTAHDLLLQHVARLLGTERETLVQAVRDADALIYMHQTRRVLGAWIYFKRFAVSVLRVETGQAPPAGGDAS